MSEEARRIAYRQQRARRVAFQSALDAALTPVSQEPAATVRTNFEPIAQFLREGPDVGEAREVEPKGDQRFN